VKPKVHIVDAATRAAWELLWPTMSGKRRESREAVTVPSPAEPDIDAVLGEPAEEGEE
jgi:hypothetical protein